MLEKSSAWFSYQAAIIFNYNCEVRTLVSLSVKKMPKLSLQDTLRLDPLNGTGPRSISFIRSNTTDCHDQLSRTLLKHINLPIVDKIEENGHVANKINAQRPMKILIDWEVSKFYELFRALSFAMIFRRFYLYYNLSDFTTMPLTLSTFLPRDAAMLARS